MQKLLRREKGIIISEFLRRIFEKPSLLNLKRFLDSDRKLKKSDIIERYFVNIFIF